MAEGEGHLPSQNKDTTQQFPLLLTFFWPELSHLDTPNLKRDLKDGLYSGQPCTELKFYYYGRRGKWVYGANLDSGKQQQQKKHFMQRKDQEQRRRP